MTVGGFDHVWNPARNNGMGGWDVFPHHDDEKDNADFLAALRGETAEERTRRKGLYR